MIHKLSGSLYAKGTTVTLHDACLSAQQLRKDAITSQGFSEEFLQHFGLRLGRLLAPQLPLATVQAAIMQTMVEARNAGAVPQLTGRSGPGSQGQGVDPPGVAGSAGRKMELVFVHDCRYVMG